MYFYHDHNTLMDVHILSLCFAGKHSIKLSMKIENIMTKVSLPMQTSCIFFMIEKNTDVFSLLKVLSRANCRV